MNLEARFSAVCHKSDAIEIAHLMYNEPSLIQECVDLILANNKQYSHRASWALNTLVEQYESPNLQAYVPALVASFVRADTLPAILRNLLHVFRVLEFSEEQEGLILDRCFRLLEDIQTAAAIKCLSVETIYRIAKNESVLLHELKTLMSFQLEYSSAAFRATYRKYAQLINGK
jgi:hypothetical protein